MFERFTDAARRAIVLSQEEARRLGDDHIGTEHLLLGLIHEGEGAAAQVFASLGITLDAGRTAAERLGGHDVNTEMPAHVSFSPRAKQVMERALREALNLGHHFIGAEHLLLGLIRESEGGARAVLATIGMNPVHVEGRLMQILAGHDPTDPVVFPPRPAARPAPVPGPVPAACGFCGIESPTCGTLFVGATGALICERCLAVGAMRSRADSMQSGGPRSQVVLGPGVNEPPSVKQLAGRVEPTGPPPTDEDTARREIEIAYVHAYDKSDDGLDLPNVDGGEGLGPYADRAGGSVPAAALTAKHSVEGIKFLDATTATVWWTIEAFGQPVPAFHRREGRALFVGGRWKVDRATAVATLQSTGVICPPRADPPKG